MSIKADLAVELKYFMMPMTNVFPEYCSVSPEVLLISFLMSCLLFYETYWEWRKTKNKIQKKCFTVTKANIYHLMTMQSASDPFPFHIRAQQFHCLETMYIRSLNKTQRNDTFNFVVEDVVVVFFLLYAFFSIAIFWHKYSNKKKRMNKKQQPTWVLEL